MKKLHTSDFYTSLLFYIVLTTYQKIWFHLQLSYFEVCQEKGFRHEECKTKSNTSILYVRVATLKFDFHFRATTSPLNGFKIEKKFFAIAIFASSHKRVQSLLAFCELCYTRGVTVLMYKNFVIGYISGSLKHRVDST